MKKTRFTQGIVLACMTVLAACTSGDDGVGGNTELIVVIPNGGPAVGGGSSAPGLEFIATVEYTINCLGSQDPANDPGFLPDNPGGGSSFEDEVQINGNLAVVGGRPNPVGSCSATTTQLCELDGDCPSGETCEGESTTVTGLSEVWQGFMDLPPGVCSVELRAADSDGEVICTDTVSVDIAPSSLNQVSLALICDVSFQAPVGSLDVDGTFQFRVGNFCPDLFIANCLNDNPPLRDVLGPGNPLLAGTQCEVRTRDGDSNCGNSCDPQTCVETADGSGLTCTPANGNLRCTEDLARTCENSGDCPAGTGTCGPAGLVTVVTCTNSLIDCDGDGVPDGNPCVWAGDLLGEVGQGPEPPSATLLPGVWNATCDPFGAPGAVVECTATVSDGDTDCDKVKVTGFNCPGLTPCAQYAADGFNCDDGTVCTADSCDDSLAVAGSCGAANNGACCVNDPAGTDGDDCSIEITEPIGKCNVTGTDPGVCQPDICTSDAQCAAGTPVCFVGQTCNFGTGLCQPEPPIASGSGTACDAGSGASSGACDGAGACVDICTFNPACPDDVPSIPDNSVCTAASCDPVDGTCGQTPANSGGTCDFSGSGSADGTCASGVCGFTPDSCGLQAQVVGLGCSNSVTRAQSPFPWTLSVDLPNPLFAGQPFDVTFDGQGFFPELFLDIAQSSIGGGVRVAELGGFVSTVQVRSGATGPDVELSLDIGSVVPGVLRFCNFPTDLTCTADGDCVGGTCNPPIVVANIPIDEDCCVVGGGCACDAIYGKAAQCLSTGVVGDPDVGWCVTGPLVVQLEEKAANGNYTATNDADISEVLFGWAERGVPDYFICPGQPGDDAPGGAGTADTRCASNESAEPAAPDGTLAIPYASNLNPIPPIGIRVAIPPNASQPLAVAIQCGLGIDGGRCGDGVANPPLTTPGCLTDADCTVAPNTTCMGAGGACFGGADAGDPCYTDGNCTSGVCDFTVTADNDVILVAPDDALISCPIN